jgi:hypothetical protein
LFCCKKKDCQKKENIENIENFGDSKRFDELAKYLLDKATPTTPNKKLIIVFVLTVHQKTGFVSANIRHIKNIKLLIAQKQEMENYVIL